MGIGATYSIAHYDEYRETGNKNIWEEIIDNMMLGELSPELQERIKDLPLYQKRIAILAFLDKDRDLFMKIKSFISNEKLSKVDHLKEVILMLREYVKVADIEKKKFGEVMTDLNLVKHILSKIPKENFSNPNIKFLDCANGTGVFPLVVLYRLMIGLKDIIPDADERYKHIIENQIYASEIQPKNMFLYMCLVDPYDEYNLNIYTGSSLDEGFDRHMKEVWKVDKFDFCIGNPPYNQMIDMLFVQKFYRLSDVVLFVHPSTWLIDEKGKQKKFTETKELIKDHLESIELFNGNKVFGICLFVPCVITYINKHKKGDTIQCLDKINDVELNYNDIFEINKFSNIDVYPQLKSKILNRIKSSIDKYKIFNISTKRNSTVGKISRYTTLNTTGEYYVNIAQIRGNVDLNSDTNMIKNDFYTIVSRDNKVESKIDNHMFFKFVKQKDAENFLAYLKTNFSRFCLSIYKNNSQLECGELSLIPWLDFSREWSEEDLIKEFNLTEEEVKFIDKNIPKYYE